MLTDEQVAAIAARLKAAARAPWTMTPETQRTDAAVWAHDGDRVAMVDGGQAGEIDPGHMVEADDNAAFIAHAPEDIVALLAERAALLEILRLARAECQWREARETAAMEIVQMVARAMVICGHAPQPDYLCPHYADGKAWPLRTKARALLGLSWVQEPQP